MADSQSHNSHRQRKHETSSRRALGHGLVSLGGSFTGAHHNLDVSTGEFQQGPTRALAVWRPISPASTVMEERRNSFANVSRESFWPRVDGAII